jgi:hypothetical protein
MPFAFEDAGELIWNSDAFEHTLRELLTVVANDVIVFPHLVQNQRGFK